jgi:hypothetical protein
MNKNSRGDKKASKSIAAHLSVKDGEKAKALGKRRLTISGVGCFPQQCRRIYGAVFYGG